jgi:hypothetical protein
MGGFFKKADVSTPLPINYFAVLCSSKNYEGEQSSVRLHNLIIE